METVSNMAHSAYNAAASAASGTIGLAKAVTAVAVTMTELSMQTGQGVVHFTGYTVGSAAGLLTGVGKAVYNCRDENAKSLNDYIIESVKHYSDRAVALTDKPLIKGYKVTSVSGICGYAVAALATSYAASWLGASGLASQLAVQLIHIPKIVFGIDVMDAEDTEQKIDLPGGWHQDPEEKNILIHDGDSLYIYLEDNKLNGHKMTTLLISYQNSNQ